MYSALQPDAKLLGVQKSFYYAIRRAMASAGPCMRTFDHTTGREVLERTRPWCLSHTISLVGDSSLLLNYMEAIATQSWRFPLLCSVYFECVPGPVSAAGESGFLELVRAMCASKDDRSCGGRIVDLHIRVNNSDVLVGGTEHFWSSFMWCISCDDGD